MIVVYEELRQACDEESSLLPHRSTSEVELSSLSLLPLVMTRGSLLLLPPAMSGLALDWHDYVERTVSLPCEIRTRYYAVLVYCAWGCLSTDLGRICAAPRGALVDIHLIALLVESNSR